MLEPGVYRVIVQPHDEDKAERSTDVRIEAGKTVVAKLRE